MQGRLDSQHRHVVLLGQLAGHGGAAGLTVVGGEQQVGVVYEVMVSAKERSFRVDMARGGGDVGLFEEPVVPRAQLRRLFRRLIVEGADHLQNHVRMLGTQFNDGFRGEHIHAQCAAGDEVAIALFIE